MASTVLCSFASFHSPTHMAEQSVHIYSMHCTSFDGSMRSGQFCMVECQPCGSSNNIYFIIESNNRMDRQFSKCKNVIKRIHTICFGSYCMHIYTMHVEHWSSHLHTHTRTRSMGWRHWWSSPSGQHNHICWRVLSVWVLHHRICPQPLHLHNSISSSLPYSAASVDGRP